MNPADLSATQAAQLIRSKQLSAVELAQACLARALAREPVLQAWAHLDAQQALAQAQALDQTCARASLCAPAQGLLHGLPLAVKDIIDTADMPTRYGSPIYRQHQPRADAACVALARDAGAWVMGKTHTTEFASIFAAPTTNPHNPAHTPGGSSSGSAAAVADGQVPLAYGTQTAGSTIRPAAYCGVVGYKPSFNRINRAGLKFTSESLDTLGLFARHVADVALLAHALTGQGPLAAADPRAAPRSKPWRVGVHRSAQAAMASPDAQKALAQAALRLSAAGAQVQEVMLDADMAALYDQQGVVMRYETSRAMAWETQHHRGQLSEGFLQRIDAGWATPYPDYAAAMDCAHQARHRLAATWQTVDVLLTYSAPGEAPTGLASTGDSVFNRNWTLLGVPCIHLPTTRGAQGLPLGVQLVGAFGQDLALLEAAHWAEAVLAS